MPKRNRYRTIFKKARFGGTCVEESFWTNIDETEGLVWQNEDCKLCPEHCLTPNNTDILNYPLLSYPGDDAQCVGYCPSMVEVILCTAFLFDLFKWTVDGEMKNVLRIVWALRKSFSMIQCKMTLTFYSFLCIFCFLKETARNNRWTPSWFHEEI